MKNLRDMTVKQIKAYMKENNISIDKAYKMRKAELIEAIEIIESVDEKINSMKLKTYKADYEDENFEIIIAHSDEEAFDVALGYEIEHGALFNVFEVDDNYDEIREVNIYDFDNAELDLDTEETKEEIIKQADDKTQEIDISTLYTCKLNLGDADEDISDWEESDKEYFELDKRHYEGLIEELENKYGDKLDHIEDYRYSISNLEENDLEVLEELFSDTESNLDYCYIKYDFMELEAV